MNHNVDPVVCPNDTPMEFFTPVAETTATAPHGERTSGRHVWRSATSVTEFQRYERSSQTVTRRRRVRTFGRTPAPIAIAVNFTGIIYFLYLDAKCHRTSRLAWIRKAERNQRVFGVTITSLAETAIPDTVDQSRLYAADDSLRITCSTRRPFKNYRIHGGGSLPIPRPISCCCRDLSRRVSDSSPVV